MKIVKALKIARREWGNIRTSLEKCDDIGEFDSENSVNYRLTETEGLRLVRSLIKMDNKIPTYGYFTKDAAYVFTTLASSAAERLGLVGRLAQSFGRGYSWVRTGWFDGDDIENQHVIKQMIFFNLFFLPGEDLRWDFNSPEVKMRLKTAFDKFVSWQDMPSSYIQDVRNYKNQLESLFFGSAYH